MGSGLADISYTTTIGFEDYFPIGDWLSTAMSPDTRPFPLGDLANYAAANDFIAHSPEVQAEYEALGVKPLWMISASPGDMLCTEPSDGLADAEGRLTRSPGARITSEVEALGMTSASMAFADLYEGLQRKAIDCVYTTAGSTTFKPFGLTEVAKYYAPVNGWTPLSAAGFIINLDVWNSFPKELQQVVEEASIEALATHSSGAFEVIAEFGATAEADGVGSSKSTSSARSSSNCTTNFTATGSKRRRTESRTPRVSTPNLVSTLPWAVRDAFADGPGSIDWDAFAAAFHHQAESKK